MWYKVVDTGPQGYTSVCQNPAFPESYRVVYKINKWVKPRIKGTRLFVFSSLEDAKHFASLSLFDDPLIKIFECDVKDPEREMYISQISKIENYWQNKPSGGIPGDEFVSVCRNSNFPEHFRVKYELNEFTYPKINNTRLFVFKTKKDAINFIHEEFRSLCYIKLFKCEVLKPRKVRYLSNVKNIEAFWETKAKKKSLKEICKWAYVPRGTYSASAVKLLEEVQY